MNRGLFLEALGGEGWDGEGLRGRVQWKSVVKVRGGNLRVVLAEPFVETVPTAHGM